MGIGVEGMDGRVMSICITGFGYGLDMGLGGDLHSSSSIDDEYVLIYLHGGKCLNAWVLLLKYVLVILLPSPPMFHHNSTIMLLLP